jgi:SAM-dependent methyltransferase
MTALPGAHIEVSRQASSRPGQPRSCPLCGSATARDAGPILHPEPNLVAGVPIDLGASRFILARCSDCGFMFKDPPIPQDKLFACYARANKAHWGEEVDPIHRYFDRILGAVKENAPGSRVLDVGCFNGSMLQYFGSSWERFGVEPSTEAAALARQRGVTVLGDSLENVQPGYVFDAIVSVDVIEHISEPVGFFDRAASLLAPGGVLVSVTGDTGSLPWTLEGSMHWYCSMVEHVSFYNERCMGVLARRCGMLPIGYVRTRHQRAGIRERAAETVKNAAYIAGHAVRGFGLPPLRRLFVDRRAPGWGSARDHMIFTMKRS